MSKIEYLIVTERSDQVSVTNYIKKIIQRYFASSLSSPKVRISHYLSSHIGLIKRQSLDDFTITLSSNPAIDPRDYHNACIHLLIHYWQYQQHRLSPDHDYFDRDFKQMTMKPANGGRHHPHHGHHFHEKADDLNQRHYEVWVTSHSSSEVYSPTFTAVITSDDNQHYAFRTRGGFNKRQLCNLTIEMNLVHGIKTKKISVYEEFCEYKFDAPFIPVGGKLLKIDKAPDSLLAQEGVYRRIMEGMKSIKLECCFESSYSKILQAVSPDKSFLFMATDHMAMFIDSLKSSWLEEFQRAHLRICGYEVKQINICTTNSPNALYFMDQISSRKLRGHDKRMIDQHHPVLKSIMKEAVCHLVVESLSGYELSKDDLVRYEPELAKLTESVLSDDSICERHPIKTKQDIHALNMN